MFHSGINNYPAWYTKMMTNQLILIHFEEHLNTIGWGSILMMVVPILFEVFRNLV